MSPTHRACFPPNPGASDVRPGQTLRQRCQPGCQICDKEIGAFLEKNAGNNRHAAPGKPVLRITETRWFQHEHDDEVSARIWKNPKVKSAANCAACHVQAESGNFSEHNIRIPK